MSDLYSLTFNETKHPMAVIKGGKYDKKIIYLRKKEDDKDDKKPIKLKEKMNSFKSFEIPKGDDGVMFPVPRLQSRLAGYVAGSAGAGKSWWSAEWATAYKKIFPDNDVYLFSKLGEDESIDRIEPIRVKLDEDLFEEPIDSTELGDSLVIFDDTDTLQSKKVKYAVNELKDDLLQVGRHDSVNVLITSHLINNYKETRIVLNECQFVVLFPNAGAWRSVKYFYEHYMGLSKQQLKKIRNLPTRWVMSYKTTPNMIIYEKGIYLLIDDD